MKHNRFLSSGVLLIASIAVLLIGKGCGGGGGSPAASLPASEIPAVSALTDAKGIALDGATNVSFTSLHLTFAEAVDLALLSQPGVVTITCAGMPASVAQPSFQIRAADNDAADGIVGNEFTIDVADGYKYQLLDCSLSIAATPPSASSSLAAKAAGSSPTTATFTNRCARSSDFNAGDKETACWDLNTFSFGTGGGPPTWDSWPSALGSVVDFNVDLGALDWYPQWNNLNEAVFTAGKSVVVGDVDLEIKIHLTNIGTFNKLPDPKGMPTGIGMLIFDSYRNGYFIGASGDNCGAIYMVNGSLEDNVQRLQDNSVPPVYSCDPPTAILDTSTDPPECRCDPATMICVSGNTAGCFGDEMYLKLTLSQAAGTASATASASWSTDNVNWSVFDFPYRPSPTDTFILPPLAYHHMTGEVQFGLLAIQAGMDALRASGSPLMPHASVDALTIEGATSNLQY